MAFYSELTVNISKVDTKLVISPQQPSPLAQIPTWFLGEVRRLKVCFVRLAAAGAAAVDVVPSAGVALRVLYGDPGQPYVTSATAGPAVNNLYTVILPLNTPDVAAFLGALPNRTAMLQFELTELTPELSIHRYQVPITLCCPVGDTPLVDPPIPDTALGTTAATAMFLAFDNAPGITYKLRSPNGLWMREIGVTDEGSGLDEITAVPP